MSKKPAPTRTAPTEDGLYWWRGHRADDWELCEVENGLARWLGEDACMCSSVDWAHGWWWPEPVQRPEK